MQSVAAPEESLIPRRTLSHASYDLVIIGGGSAGLTAASLARALGASVALVDREKLGGECLYTGCVPSKALLHAARVAAAARDADAVGLHAAIEPVDLGTVMDYVQRAIGQVYVQSDEPKRLEAQGIDVAFGESRFLSPRAFSVNGQTITAHRYLLATGSHPIVPEIPGLREARFLTNKTIFALRALPERLTVIGGGPVGCELGQAFARLGSQVTILQRAERLLPRDEPEASAALQARLEREGVTVMTGAEVSHIAPLSPGTHGGSLLTVAAVGQTREMVADAIVVATGRAPNIADLDLDAAGVQYDTQRGVSVDATLRTRNSRIYAAGDVTGGYRFTHVAARDARIAVRNALFPGRRRRDTRVTPWATFTEPEVAHVGLTEAEARRQRGADVRVFTQRYAGIDRAVTDDATDGFLKLVSARDGELLGAQIVGPRAGDTINELALALAQRLTLSQIAATTHVYPTFALAIQQAAGAWTMERTSHSAVIKLLRWLSP